ncbi:MAG: beta-N-acetylhexosaminidase, partial [Pseudomonadota bacterium]
MTPDEAAFFRDADPWGFILFARNVETPDQLRRLCRNLRDAVGRDALIFVDQEGGRVQRLRQPHWRTYPSATAYGALYDLDRRAGRRAAFLAYRLIADDLRGVGIDADCAPVLDIPQPGADPIISDRAFGTKVNGIVDLAHAAMAGLMCGGVAPVIKHMPGHGRATVDSHLSLPRIDTDLETLSATDFEPFRQLGPAPMAMTAHIVLSYVNERPVTLSRQAIQTVIRDQIGYDGLLMTDDLDMKALQGNSLSAKARSALDAGCDVVLQCSGQLSDMMAVADGVRPLSGKSLERAHVAVLSRHSETAFDRDSAETEFDRLMSRVTS